MQVNDSTSRTSRLKLFIFLIVFVATAAWGGYVLAKNAHLNRAKGSADPIEDRSLFGR